MSDNQSSFVSGYLTCLLGVGSFYMAKLFYEEIKKYLTISNFLRTGKTLRNASELNYKKENNTTKQFVILEGHAKKLFTRSGNYIDPNIILSKAYSTYYEDFLLKLQGGSVLIQPYPNTNLSHLKKEYIGNVGFFGLIFRSLLFNQSDVLKTGDKVFIFGEINRDKTYVPDDTYFTSYVNIKPKFISEGQYYDFTYALKSTYLSNSFFLFCWVCPLRLWIYLSI